MKKNYSKMFNQELQDPVKVEDEVQIPEVKKEKKFIERYFVDYCKHVNVRSAPNKKAKVICILKEGDELFLNKETYIDQEPDAEGWASIYRCARVNKLPIGENVNKVQIEGYVMSQFIRVDKIEV